AVPRGGEGPRRRPREDERERRRDRARASAGCVGRAARAHPGVRVAQAREALRPRVAVHRRRTRDRGDLRARLEELGGESLELADLAVVVAPADHHQVDAGLLHRADLTTPEAFLLRCPDACGERRPGSQRAQLASVFSDALRRLEPDEEAGAALRRDAYRAVALPADPER